MDFKTKSIGPTTPAVLLAQAAEMKWKGIVLVGFLDEGEGKRAVAFNYAGLNDGDFQFLARKVESLALQNVEDIPYHGPRNTK